MNAVDCCLKTSHMQDKSFNRWPSPSGLITLYPLCFDLFTVHFCFIVDIYWREERNSSKSPSICRGMMNENWMMKEIQEIQKMIIWLDHLHYGILFSLVRILLLQRVLITDQHIFHENFFQANCYSGEMMSKYMYILSSEKCFFYSIKTVVLENHAL